MASAKATQLGRDIDNARCVGNWVAIPELARRYKKYNSEGTILEQTVLAEATFVQLLAKIRASLAATNYQLDNPDHISMEQRLDLQQIKPIQDQLLTIVQSTDATHESNMQREFSRVILARTHYECGEYDKAIQIIEKLSFEKEHVSQGYGLVLFLKARAMKAISYELMGNQSAAIQSYEGVESLLSEYPNVKYSAFIEWSEESLYRAILLGLREEYPVSTQSLLRFIRQYQKQTATQPNNWRLQKRLVITRHSLSYLSKVYRSGNYESPASQKQQQEGESKRQMFMMEQTQLHTTYEKMLYLDTPLPKAGQVNSHILDFIDQLASDFELIGATTHELRGFVEVLDRASQRTFNSPSITRHLFNALFRLGEYTEAQHALHAYLYLVGLVSHGWKESRQDGMAVAIDRTRSSIPAPHARPDIVKDSTERRPSNVRESMMSDMTEVGDVEKEQVKDILHVLLDAIRMYCQELDQGVDAVEIAEMAKELYQKQPKYRQATDLAEVGASVYRALGSAYSLLASQTFDPTVRPAYHEKALGYLKQAIEMNSNAWQAYYQLALQQAEMRDIGQAIQSISQSLQHHPKCTASWHLLTLLVSCPIQNDDKQALKMCEMGLEQIALADVGFDEAENHMLLQMSRTLLLERTSGSEVALESLEALFGFYRKLAVPEVSVSTTSSDNFAHHGMITSGSFGNLSELPIATEQRKRGRSASNSTVMSHLPSSSAELGNNTSQLLTIPDNGSANNSQQPSHHHHLPHSLNLFGSRSTSLRKSYLPEGNSSAAKSNMTVPTSPYDTKSIAGNSVTSFQSITPSMNNSSSILQPNMIPTKPTARNKLQKERSDRMLTDLWLLTSRLFLKLDKQSEARKALEEAENIDWISNPQVWCRLGQLLQAESDQEQARSAFYKALVVDPYDVASRLELAKSHLLEGNQEIAEGILDVMTQSNGWNCAEAWFHLGEIYRQTDRMDRTKACLFYALELESTTPVQPFSILPRFI
ncbi:hypothetical protein BD560DRAFT_237956 [Blakeslea trispora]|nr:hypothetical protein BD560DRAFT_237956 [Blakeslea trispora]